MHPSSLTLKPCQSSTPSEAQAGAIGVLRWEAAGCPVGLIQLEELRGNSTNIETYTCPVLFEHVPGANLQSVVLSPSTEVLESMIQGGERLIAAGARAITTSCGFNAVFQRELSKALTVPVFTSSMLQIAMIRAMFGENCRILVVTASGQSLTRRHFDGVGITNLDGIHVVGLEENREWRKIFESPESPMDVDRFRCDLIDLTQRHASEQCVHAILLECTDLPPFADDIRRETGLPVFDFVTLLNYIQHAVIGNPLSGLLANSRTRISS